MAFSAIVKLHKSVRSMVFHDRMEFYESMANEAQTAANHSDMRGTYSIVKRLLGFTVRAPKAIKQKDGSLAASEQARQERWQEHFNEVCCGKISEDRASLSTSPHAIAPRGPLD
eukprot:1592072-Heterocapsa_arctica.AAC.1